MFRLLRFGLCGRVWGDCSACFLRLSVSLAEGVVRKWRFRLPDEGTPHPPGRGEAEADRVLGEESSDQGRSPGRTDGRAYGFKKGLGGALTPDRNESSDDRPQMPLKIPARQGGICTLTENVAFPFPAEARQINLGEDVLGTPYRVTEQRR